ncbi:MAG: hypothetical protein NVSMB64_00450 [Candidatus Velthaea sp.]
MIARAVRRHLADVVLIAVALIVQRAPIDSRWLENGYANGIYAALARTFVPLANALPFTLGDVLLFAIVFGLGAYWIARLRAARAARWRETAHLVVRTAAILAAIAIWFDIAWALNYRRAPIIARVAYDPARVNAANVSAFSKRIVDDLNRTAPLAHAALAEPPEQTQAALARAFEPVVARLGDRWNVVVSRPKTTIVNRWFAIAGIGGTWDPLAYETILNSEFLPFERWFALAHEWGHVAGFGDESDANLIGALTTLRSDDPLIRYSGLFWTYGFLPQSDRDKLPVSKLVYADLVAARQRFLQHYNPKLFTIQWFAYDKYLRANRVSAGVVSYSLFVQTLVGTPLDAQGLPLMRAAARTLPSGG